MTDSIIHISFAKLDYQCPHCDKVYHDENDELCEKLNKSKKGYLKMKCDNCKNSFGYTVDMTSKAVAFSLK